MSSNFVILITILTVVHGNFNKRNKDIVMTLGKDEIYDILRTILHSKFTKKLEEQFASAAASQFINEIKNRHHEREIYRSPRQEDSSENQERLLTDSEAEVLINAPSPDGDNLERTNVLSDLEVDSDDRGHKIPVLGVTRINGVYYRRLLGMI